MFSHPIFALIFLLLLWTLNALSSFFYLRKVNNRIVHYKKMYKGKECYLGASVENVSMLRKVMMIMVTNASGEVLECDYLYGFTNLSNFKRKKEFIGTNIRNIEIFKKDKFFKALNTTVMQIENQLIVT